MVGTGCHGGLKKGMRQSCFNTLGEGELLCKMDVFYACSVKCDILSACLIFVQPWEQVFEELYSKITF